MDWNVITKESSAADSKEGIKNVTEIVVTLRSADLANIFQSRLIKNSLVIGSDRFDYVVKLEAREFK